MPNRRKEGPCIRPQVTLRNRNALIVRAVAVQSGKSEAATVEWMVDQWLNGAGRQILLDAYSLDIRSFQQRPKVVPIRPQEEDLA
jgi:hypothetical protein